MLVLLTIVVIIIAIKLLNALPKIWVKLALFAIVVLAALVLVLLF